MTSPSPPIEHRAATAADPPIEIHRSHRRRRSASAAARDGVVVVRLPAGLPHAEEERLVTDLVRKVTGATRAAARGGDAGLERRAATLADRYLDGVRASSVRWSARMQRRYGSCTPADGSIRISRELARAPAYVLDHVLVHELAHLQEAGHGPRFHALVARHPHADRATGWLEGYSAGRLADRAGHEPEGEGTDGALGPAQPDDLVDGGAIS
ncbi:M48 family metallopeptidase [Nitriliruptor alkaliphilus]|uniref:M48 metallopeptidase family protein n=1 Tax=Nitriliruptor alkaliphilus TaxID=427918 RepID=UPI000A5F5C69|nr:M48 family metallopeptidase [Nitriliruptor alkaliphilus]